MYRFLLICVSFLPLSAQALEIVRGQFTQGGFMVGQVRATDTVSFDGEAVPVGRSGLFVVGFSRHQAQQVHIKVTTQGGDVTEKVVPIAKRSYDVQHIKGVQQKHVDPDPKQLAWIQSDSKKINAAREVFADLPYVKANFAWPVSDTISGVYGSSRTFNGQERSWHKGLDIAAPRGTPIVAPADGVVRLALPKSFFNGNMIVLDHGHQLYTYYAHLDRLDVRTGQVIMAGDVLGTVGATGRATGPHLHWGLYWRKIALDPKLLMTEGGNN